VGRATAIDVARGGAGGSVLSGFGTGGAGGDATSSAQAVVAAGGSATSEAFGGSGGAGLGGGAGGAGGDAFARAQLVAFAPQGDAIARAHGGTGAETAADGDAIARAEGQFERVQLDAAAESGGASFERGSGIRATVVGTTLGDGAAEARAGNGSAAPDLAVAAGLRGAAFSHGAPDLAEAAAWIAGNADVEAGIGGAARVLALGVLGASSGEPTEAIAVSTTISFDFAADSASLADGPLRIGFLDPVVEGAGFDTLHIRITGEESAIVDQAFDDVASALAWFDDRLIDVSTGAGSTSNLFSVDLAYTSDDPGAAFRTDLVLATPEPGTALLLGLGLAGLAGLAKRWWS
jgi:hypothetical protein